MQTRRSLIEFILYGVETRVLNQAVKRNEKRFPKDFMFQLTIKEFENLKSQFVASNKNLISQTVISSWGGIRKLPLAFTEQGVAMLSSILNSETAIEVNIQSIKLIFEYLKQLLTPSEQANRRRIGFRRPGEEQ